MHSAASGGITSLGSVSSGGGSASQGSALISEEQIQLGSITEQLSEVLERLSRLEEAVRETRERTPLSPGTKEAQAAPGSVQRFCNLADAIGGGATRSTLTQLQVPVDQMDQNEIRLATGARSHQTLSTSAGRLTVPDASAPTALCRTA
eukprot:544503-Prymnesium_polylepis.2